jgi:hypothetical protein
MINGNFTVKQESVATIVCLMLPMVKSVASIIVVNLSSVTIVQQNVELEKSYVRSDKNENFKYALLWANCAM